MSRVLVIGYGNPLRGDDGLGPTAAQQLAASVDPRNVQVLTPYQLAPELAEAISAAQFVLFIDAAEEGEPGTLTYTPISADPGSTVFTHNMDPAALLALAKVLYGCSPVAFSITITGENFGHGEGLSSIVQEKLPTLLTRAREVMAE